MQQTELQASQNLPGDLMLAFSGSHLPPWGELSKVGRKVVPVQVGPSPKQARP